MQHDLTVSWMWQEDSLPDLTDTLVALTHDFLMLESVQKQRFQCFVLVMYSKGCSAADVNAARHQLFNTVSKMLKNIPPTQATLFQHVKRALLQQVSTGVRPS